MSDNLNPYAAPNSEVPSPVASSINGDKLAGRGIRLVASLVDGVLIMGVMGPIYFLTGFFARAAQEQVGALEMLSMTLLAIVVMLAFNGYLLYSRGQTIGKMLLKIQIVDEATGLLLPFLRVYVFRYLWLMPLSIVTMLIPGTADDLVVSVLSIINALLIFGVAQRCLHDYIAGSRVVLFRPDRARLE